MTHISSNVYLRLAVLALATAPLHTSRSAE